MRPWVPVAKFFAVDLPKDRPFSRVEAAYSLQLDLDRNKQVTLSGYASRWRWSKDRVIRFLKILGAKIQYPADTSNKRNQRGRLIICLNNEYNPNDPLLINLIPSKDIAHLTDQGATNERLKTDQRQAATNRENKNKNINIPFSEIISYLNLQTGKNFKASSKNTRRFIQARWAEGFRLKDFFAVIDRKAATWGNMPEMSVYLRPETLFGTKFEAYLNENDNRASGPTTLPPPKEFDFANQFKGE